MTKKGSGIEEILPSLYKIEIPIPENPLGVLNSYVIKGGERNLIIDTGVNHRESVEAMFSGLRRLDIDLNTTDFFVTHLHVDHLGLVKKLATESSKLFFNHPEAACVNSDQHWKAIYSWENVYLYYLSHGFPEGKLKESIRAYPGYEYATGKDVQVLVLKEGDVIKVGQFSFRCIETPGHSPGHMCLYEDTEKVLLSGDHMLLDISPNIALLTETENPLKAYLASLDKLIPLKVKLVLPAHKQIFSDHKKRIRELKQHHENRLDEILSILEKGEQNAYDIARQMTWDIECNWDRLPLVHKFASFGETTAHLKYLEVNDRVMRKKGRTEVFFSLREIH